ncbi:NAD(P)-dependent alcohol dehydrogenase [Cohaesibacter celericrescens]|uniref:NAD(P)-dependent alcohol dehydrogenase n=1 Tax=Cohaesibacter celericrescens TaxID=2067669 RepID=A0A2N5XNE4_9HYPH|nr:NAD(P)-dependent alcohol dehydrogenase [Cohaesibacter celericrescens]PLW75927.1 NAD(P)-dependent alcohol dehydrogenase [Cohaesibacter celericrescens]
MLAAVATKYGPADVLKLRQIAQPTPKPDEVIVRVEASSVTAADVMMRRGVPYIGRLFLGILKPKNSISGTGFAGTVQALGSQVHAFRVGDRVFGETILGHGANAEYTCVPQDGLIMHLPDNVPFTDGATLCDGFLTSMNFLKRLVDVKSGQRVLINGASGSLGTAAIQIARYFGAHVTGVSSASNHDLVASLGANQVIDYNSVDFTQSEQNWDVIYDTVGKSSFDKCKAVLSENGKYLSPILGGTLCSMLQTKLFGTKQALFSATGLLPQPVLKKLLVQVRDLRASEELRVFIDRQYQFDQIIEAHRYVEGGHKKGNVLLQGPSRTSRG